MSHRKSDLLNEDVPGKGLYLISDVARVGKQRSGPT